MEGAGRPDKGLPLRIIHADPAGVLLFPFDLAVIIGKDDRRKVSEHQMLINGKSGDITANDYLAVANDAGIKKSEATESEEQIREAISKWDYYAEEAELTKSKTDIINEMLKR